ncbi:DUF748 domain-containing protein [Sulfurimonas paralvinellae]|uniref:DUF748 domain-containing protein n=1 Tax=Sulfurimonas paralvinellae TaxID=317658 RepID=A0A7M1BA70_9BACT|nr:DUF748 domain-containing protein [Sulfurimonas paralvinellae]QOP46619.1 DUF748 domain-containing protein [Sulfurimonas paralvinellae]
MLKKIIKYLFYLFVAYLFIGFFILPFVLKPQLVKTIEYQTRTKVTIESLSFNPLIFTLKASNIHLKALDDKPLFALKRLEINLNPSSLLYGAVHLKELSLVMPEVHLVYNKDKSINLLNVIKENNQTKILHKESKKSELPRIIVDKIKLENGRLYYTDFTRKTPFEFSLENIGFALNDFDTKNITKNSAGLRLYSKLGDGGFVDFQSQILSIVPFKIKGTLDFQASKLYTEWKYMQDVLKLEVADGKVSFHTKYMLNLDDINATKIDDLNLAVDKLRIKPKDEDRDILNLDSLYVKNALILPMQQNVQVKKVGLHGLKVKAKRYKNGSIDWLELTKMPDSEINATQQTPQGDNTSKPWNVTLQSLALEKIFLEFKDESIVPNVTTTVKRLDIYADDLTLAGEKPFSYQIKLQLNESGMCDINGTLAHKKLNLATYAVCKNLDIAHYRPYIDKAAKKNLKKYDLSLEHALLDLEAAAQVQEHNNTLAINVNDANLSLKKLFLDKTSTKEKLAQFKDFTIKGIVLDSEAKELQVADVALNDFTTNVVRYKDAKLNVADVVVAKEAKQGQKQPKSAKAEKPFRVKIKHIAMNNAKVLVEDRAISKVQKQRLDKINVIVHDFDIQKRSWLRYKASMRINRKGKLTASGKLQHTPLKQSGTLSLQRLSLKELTPYLQEQSYVSIDDGRFSLRVDESYSKSKKYPDVRVHGEAALDSLFISNTNDVNSSLFSLNELRIKPFTLELFPNRLYIDNVAVDSFYVAAKIDENKTINFAKLMKQSAETNENNVTTAVDKNISKKTKKSFPVKIAKINVTNGSASFSDLSLPIKFKTDIHDLNGAVYAVSNSPGDTTYINIDGEVDKYGSTKLSGSVDSFNPKEYTDLSFNFKNLDLHNMSGYSASFAGYPIDSGKLYLDLGYQIMHSELSATNNIMIKKIKLGKEMEGDDVNHLPLGFVIGLLEDSDGIIDIDMPIKGNVDEPDFKYGALVWKTLGNLIAKAVTSPFKFLGSMMGLDGEELEFIAFEFGKSDIMAPQREKLDKLAKLMNKRPKLILQVNAVYDEVYDLKALKRQKLIAMVIQKSGDENIKNKKTALNIDMLEDLYAQLHEDDKQEKLKEKLEKEYKDDDKAYERAYQNALIELCTQIQPVSEEELNALAKQRVVKIQNYLIEQKSLNAQRVAVGKLEKLHKGDEEIVKLNLDIEVQSSDK